MKKSNLSKLFAIITLSSCFVLGSSYAQDAAPATTPAAPSSTDAPAAPTDTPSSSTTPASGTNPASAAKLKKFQDQAAKLDAQIKGGSLTGDALTKAQSKLASLQKKIAKLLKQQ